MKQSIKFITCIILALALHACSAKMDDPVCFDFDELLATYQNACPSVTDAIEYPEFWYDVLNPFVPRDETIRSTSTCGLLITLLERPLFVMMAPGSDLFEPRVTKFNNELQENKVAIEFFNRRDFYPVLVSKYLSVIKVTDISESAIVGSNVDGPGYIEWILASDMCLSAMSQKEKIQLMVLALERTKYAVDFEKNQACMIMISIMKSCKYIPFLKEIEPRLIETMPGYAMREPDGEITSNTFLSHHRDIIIKYAKQFLNKQKK